jgi:acetyl esterase
MPLAPEYQAMFAALGDTPLPRIADMTPAEGREMYRQARPLNPEIAAGAVADRSIPGPASDVPLRIYTPEGEGPFPVFVNFHGGGWVIGDLNTADAMCRDICRTAGCVVVSVDYRLAPEHEFPAAVDDCYAATVWVSEHMAEVNGNGKLAVGGESAGGNLAAVVCQLARDGDGPVISFQLLLYPVTDCDLERDCYQEDSGGMYLDGSTMEWFWRFYCPDPDKRRDPRASPLRAENLSGLPPALVITAEFDTLRVEGREYAEALRNAHVPAEWLHCEGLIHDFMATAAVFKASRPPFEHACLALRTALQG